MSRVWSSGPRPEPVEVYRTAEDTLRDGTQERLNFWLELLCVALGLGFCAVMVWWID